MNWKFRFCAHRFNRRMSALAVCLALFCFSAHAEDALPLLDHDPHRTAVGFFDIHVCNWPDRKPFYMALFSTTQFEEISAISILAPNGRFIGNLDLNRFRVVKNPGKPEKRVFISQLEIPAEARDGWFVGVAKTRDGKEYQARDLVVHTTLPIATKLVPPADSKLAAPPTELSWEAVPGSKYYLATIRDEWNGDQVIFASPLLTEPRVAIPGGVLKQDGRYSWRVHARDIDGSTLLGDFNHGSLSAPTRFSVESD